MRALIAILLLISLFGSAHGQNAKKSLSHDVFDSWNVLRSPAISSDASWVSYEINAQLGDGNLFIQSANGGNTYSVPRGKGLLFHPENSFAVSLIKPPYEVVRKAKLAKKKKDKMPSDSLAIWLPNAAELIKVARVKSFKMAHNTSGTAYPWIAYHLEKALPATKDTTKKDSLEASAKNPKAKSKKAKKSKAAKKATTLVLHNPLSGDTIQVPEVIDYSMSENGKSVAFTKIFGDSIDSVRVMVFHADTREIQGIYKDQGKALVPVFNKEGLQLAFLASTDTSKVKVYAIYHREGNGLAQEVISRSTKGMPSNWAPSEHGNIRFSEASTRLFLGTASIPEPEPKDSLIEDEKYHVDVWNWKDTRLQPMQKVNLARDKKANYAAVYDLRTRSFHQLADEDLQRIRTTAKDEGKWAIGYDRNPYMRASSWAFPRMQDVYLVNVQTGEKELLLKESQYTYTISPNGKYVLWYDVKDKNWYGMSVEERKPRVLTEDLGVNFFDEKFDIPSPPSPYGISGWAENDEFVYIKDRYDLWKIDPSGKKKAQNFTQGYGRENRIRFNAMRLDREQLHLDEFPLLKGFNEKSKEDGFYKSVKKGSPERLLVSDHRYGSLLKSAHANKVIWSRQDFDEFPDLWVSDLSFSNPKKLSHANPQQAEYLWGTVELVDWKAYDGQEMEGMLYKPENFDPNKKYPLLVYFYEKSSDRIHSYSQPMPSRSIIYPSYYASNGYLVFIPNINYKTGQPGPDAYNSVVSGTEHLAKTYEFVDKDRMALQGQSWGGYQIAYIVTQTDLYTAAMAGAPVSNMTSAYGGIRWATGMSRMFQYERTQSRLGVTLWEDQDLYLKNSPLFQVPNIKTPLLMMHNDADGAVPWYQGIEFFVALRRLNKPAWLLVYNNEGHNLRRWANRKDLSIRMQQFFDHYLKGAPAPVWMEEGVPAIDKGKKSGYELLELSKER